MERKFWFLLVALAFPACSHGEKKSVEPPVTLIASSGKIGVVDAENGRVDLITFASKTSRSIESFRLSPDTKVIINKSQGNAAALQSGMPATVAFKYVLSARGEYEKTATEIVSTVDTTKANSVLPAWSEHSRKW